MAARNGKPKALPRLVPGGTAAPRARKEVNLPGIGASVLLEAPSVAAWRAVEDLGLEGHDYSVALAALCLVEPEMTSEQLSAAVKEWPLSDWGRIDEALADLMGTSEEAQHAAATFRGAGD